MLPPGIRFSKAESSGNPALRGRSGGHRRRRRGGRWNQCRSPKLDRQRAGRCRHGRSARRLHSARRLEEWSMTLLKWALIFFLVSIVAGILGFTGISAATADVARFLFYVFVVIFLVLLILGLTIFRV
jgi:uncharacterized membrane protein YtjA (UPF0391 family)